MTIPWDGKSIGLIVPQRVKTYLEKMKEFDEETNRAVINDLVVQWPQILEEFRNRLSNAFDANEFPDVSELQGKFKIEVELSPIPDTDISFMSSLLGEDVTRLQELEAARQSAKLREGIKGCMAASIHSMDRPEAKNRFYESPPQPSDHITKTFSTFQGDPKTWEDG